MSPREEEQRLGAVVADELRELRDRWIHLARPIAGKGWILALILEHHGVPRFGVDRRLRRGVRDVACERLAACGQRDRVDPVTGSPCEVGEGRREVVDVRVAVADEEHARACREGETAPRVAPEAKLRQAEREDQRCDDRRDEHRAYASTSRPGAHHAVLNRRLGDQLALVVHDQRILRSGTRHLTSDAVAMRPRF